MIRFAVVLGLILIPVIPAARAELGWVSFRAGGDVELPARAEGENVVVEAPDGTHRFPRTMIRTIVPGTSDESSWSERRDQALRGGAEDRFAASWWALEHGLTGQATAMLRDAHQAGPDHQPTVRLVAMLDRLAPPCPDPRLDAVRAGLRGDFAEARGPHVLLLHQHAPAEAAQRVELLEQVLTTYYLSLSAYGLDLKPPPERLVAVWFARQDDYLHLLRSEGATAFLTTQGYYHPTKGVVFTYDLRSDASFRRRQRNLEATTERDRERRQLLLELDRRTQEIETAAHETIHQLVRISGLAPRYESLPIWLHEGLAMQFETVRGGRWAGVGRLHPFRLETWRTLAAPPLLEPTIRDEGFGRGYQPQRYAVAWSLVYFLRKQHPAQFHSLLDALRAPRTRPSRPGPVPSPHFKPCSAAISGPLEVEWRRFVDGLRLPRDGSEGA